MQLQTQFKDLETGFKTWLTKQSLPVETAVVTVISAVQGAAIGAFMETLTSDVSSSIPTPPPQAGLNPQAMASLKQPQVQLRHKLARLLGYSSFADYVVEPRMAKSSSQVFEFLEELSARLNEMATKELCVLKELKKQEEGESTFGAEDLLYYLRRAEEQTFDLDLRVVHQYFPIHLVLSGIFKIFEDLFGLKFEEILEAEVWHSDVRLFSVADVSSNELIGYFYLDVNFREGKYNHTCVMALQNGCVSSNGVRQVPVALITSQIQKHDYGSQSLLQFPEVVTLFHEFSHMVHHICNRASFARFSGLRVEPDFVEIPGQLLENWCYEASSLKMMSGFHQAFLIK